MLFKNYPKNLSKDEREKLFDKKDELRVNSFSEGAKNKLHILLIKLEESLENGKKNDPEFKSLIERFRGMNTKKHREGIVEMIIAYK